MIAASEHSRGRRSRIECDRNEAALSIVNQKGSRERCQLYDYSEKAFRSASFGKSSSASCTIHNCRVAVHRSGDPNGSGKLRVQICLKRFRSFHCPLSGGIAYSGTSTFQHARNSHGLFHLAKVLARLRDFAVPILVTG